MCDGKASLFIDNIGKELKKQQNSESVGGENNLICALYRINFNFVK